MFDEDEATRTRGDAPDLIRLVCVDYIHLAKVLAIGRRRLQMDLAREMLFAALLAAAGSRQQNGAPVSLTIIDDTRALRR